MHGRVKYPRMHRCVLAIFGKWLALLVLLATSACAPSLATRQAATLSDLGFEPTPDGWLLTLPERISFEFNQADLAPPLRVSIADAARRLLAVDIRGLRVAGHTDNIGTAEYNRDLSVRRADSVAAVFIAAGFAAENVESRGYGAGQPAADNASEEGRALNRRVEIIVTSGVLAAR